MQQEEKSKPQLVKYENSTTEFGRRQEFQENRTSNALSTGHSNSSILDQRQSPLDDACLSSTSPICRQFWKAGNYDDGLGSKVTLQSIVLSTLIVF